MIRQNAPKVDPVSIRSDDSGRANFMGPQASFYYRGYVRVNGRPPRGSFSSDADHGFDYIAYVMFAYSIDARPVISSRKVRPDAVGSFYSASQAIQSVEIFKV